MKAGIKLVTSYKETNSGFPVYVTLRHLRRRRKQCIGYSKIEFWDFANNQPIVMHPDYNNLLPLILGYRIKISKVQSGDYTFDAAADFLFNTKAKSRDFYEAGLTLCGPDTNGRVYKNALNSFKKVYPGILTDDITQDLVKKYLIYLLKGISANGAHSYLRTLNAIFNKLSDKPNPFKGVRPKKTKTKNRYLNDDEVVRLITTRTIVNKFDGQNDTTTINYARYYWMLMFYLGGIDFVDLAALRYDKHVHGNRIRFNRFKGGTSALVNNIIVPQATEILKLFDCKPYLVPIYKYSDYNSYLSKCNSNLHDRTADLKLSEKPTTKTARHTFINRAQQLLIDKRITEDIVGHVNQDTHSIYTSEFPLSVRDEAHKKIITI